MKEIDNRVEECTNKAGIRFATSSKERSLVHSAEMLRLLRAPVPALIESATGTFKVRSKGGKTYRIEGKRITYLLDAEHIPKVQTQRVWYRLGCGLRSLKKA